MLVSREPSSRLPRDTVFLEARVQDFMTRNAHLPDKLRHAVARACAASEPSSALTVTPGPASWATPSTVDVNEYGRISEERAAEIEVGGTDGLRLFRSLERWLQQRPASAERRL